MHDRREKIHMQVLARARRLAKFICGNASLNLDLRPPSPHGHVGATLADAVLQAGLNYRAVVLPRVEQMKANWPRSRVASGFQEDIRQVGVDVMLNWTHPEKPRRVMTLLQVLLRAGVESEADLGNWLSVAENRSSLLRIHGIGPKTVDYLFRLVGGPTVAADRHLIRFVVQVCPSCTAYEEVQQTVSYAADLLGISRCALDHAIWQYMSRNAADAQMQGISSLSAPPT